MRVRCLWHLIHMFLGVTLVKNNKFFSRRPEEAYDSLQWTLFPAPKVGIRPYLSFQ